MVQEAQQKERKWPKWVEEGVQQSRDEIVAEFQSYEPESAAKRAKRTVQAFAGSALEHGVAPVTDFLGIISDKAQDLDALNMLPMSKAKAGLTEALMAELGHDLRELGKVVYPEETRGEGGTEEDLAVILGGFFPELLGGAAISATAKTGSTLAKIGPRIVAAMGGGMKTGASDYYRVLNETGDEEKATIALMTGSGIGLTEAVGLGGVFNRLEKSMGRGFLRKWIIDPVLFGGAEEAAQEFASSGMSDLVFEQLTGKDVEILRNGLENMRMGGLAGWVFYMFGGGAKTLARRQAYKRALAERQRRLAEAEATGAPQEPAEPGLAPEEPTTPPEGKPETEAPEGPLYRLRDVEGGESLVGKLVQTPGGAMGEVTSHGGGKVSYRVQGASGVTEVTTSEKAIEGVFEEIPEAVTVEAAEAAPVEPVPEAPIEEETLEAAPAEPTISQVAEEVQEEPAAEGTLPAEDVTPADTPEPSAAPPPRATQELIRGQLAEGKTPVEISEATGVDTAQIEEVAKNPTREQIRSQRITAIDEEIKAKLEEKKRKRDEGIIDLRAGFDTQTLVELADMAQLYVRKGYYHFEQFAADLIAEFGDSAKPYLKRAWARARADVPDEIGERMTPERGVDLDRILTEEDVEQVKAFAEQAQAEGEATRVGEEPYGRTKLGEEPEVRATARAVDEWRKLAERPEPETIRGWEQEADKRIKKDPVKAEKYIRGKLAGEAKMSPSDHILAAQVVRQKILESIKNNDEAGYRDAVQLADRLRDKRADVAKQLTALRDPLNEAEKLAKVLATPGVETRETINFHTEAARKAKPGSRSQRYHERQVEKALNRDAKKARRAYERLHKKGIELDRMTEAELKRPEVQTQIVKEIQRAKNNNYYDPLLEFFYGNIYSGPLTHKANIFGTAGSIITKQHLGRIVEAAINDMVLRFTPGGRSPDAATLGEVVAFYKASARGLAAAFRNALRVYRTQMPVYEVDLQRRGVNIPDFGVRIDSARAPHAWRIPGVKQYMRGLRAASLDTLMAMDEFFKTAAGIMEAQALAHRKAKKEGHKGEAYAKRLEEILSDYDSKDSIYPEVHKKVRKLAYQDRDQIADAAIRLRESINSAVHFPLGSIIVPAIMTPYNVFKMGYGTAAAPVTAVAKTASKAARGRLTKADIATDWAEGLIGSAAALWVYSLLGEECEDGFPRVTGTQKIERGQREHEYRTADAYTICLPGLGRRSYRRIEPFATTVATLADMVQSVQNAVADPKKDAGDVILDFFGTTFRQVRDKTFLSSLKDLSDMIYNSVSEEPISEKAASNLVENAILGFTVPNLVRQPLRELDPKIRVSQRRKYEDTTFWEGLERRVRHKALPLASKAPPVRHDLWGRDINRYDPERSPGAQLLLQIVNPFPETWDHPATKYDVLMWNYKGRLDRGEFPDEKYKVPRQIDYWYSIERGGKTKTVYWDDEEYSELQKSAGELALRKLAGKRLNVEEPTPKDLEIINDAIGDAKKEARDRLMRRLGGADRLYRERAE